MFKKIKEIKWLISYLLLSLFVFSCDNPAVPKDCSEVTNGIAFIDDCGVCVGGTTEYEANFAKDCSGECFGDLEIDCLGGCGGDAVEDDCGVCVGDGVEENYDCDGNCNSYIDCLGDCGGDAVEDECGVCGGDGVEENYDCDGNCIFYIDCLGDCGGDAVEDECGVCNGPGPEFYYDCDNNCLNDSDGDSICDNNDGDSYQTVQIDDQLWMAENLKVTRYRNGDKIPYKTNYEWCCEEIGQYGVYNSDMTNTEIYGNLYNWYVVNDTKGVCPESWHVPTKIEVIQLIEYLGDNAGGKMKSIGMIEAGDGLWLEPNEGATNESGFTFLPSGYRKNMIGEDSSMGWYGYLWSSTENYNNFAWFVKLFYYQPSVQILDGYKQYGFPIRCVGD